MLHSESPLAHIRRSPVDKLQIALIAIVAVMVAKAVFPKVPVLDGLVKYL